MLSMFINQLPGFARVAVLRDGQLVRYLSVAANAEQAIGTLYLGRVQKVNPAIGAAFVTIGPDQQAFLNLKEGPALVVEGGKLSRQPSLKEGMGVLVQLQKPPIRDKLATVGAELKFLGFRSILLPFGRGVRFSRDFQGDQEACRSLLQELAARLGVEAGWVVRSQAGVGSLTQLETDASALLEDWLALTPLWREGSCRAIWEENPYLHQLREGYKEGWRSVICDEPELFQRLRQELMRREPSLLMALQQHDLATPLFDTYRIEEELDRLEDGRIWLKTGGALEIHQTEAMVTIDVNSGKAQQGSKSQSAALRTNLEAAAEIARQIIARNLAGLIVIDFINATDQGWTRKVEQALREGLASDTTTWELLPINKFGVAMIARQRQDRDHNHVYNEVCPRCSGRGWVKRLSTLAQEIQRKLMRSAVGMQGETFVLRAGGELGSYLQEHWSHLFEAIEQTHQIKLTLQTINKAGRSYTLELM